MADLHVRSAISVAALCTIVVACGGKARTDPPGTTTCPPGADGDGDSYGDGCPAGADCDDGDALVHEGCSPCAGEASTGCPCTSGKTVSCFDGTAVQAATPPCRKGARRCDAATSTWGACEGEVAPETEICDGTDNDCDGITDEGVLSACGDCTTGCSLVGIGDGVPFPLPGDVLPPGNVAVSSDGVGLDANGDLVLDLSSIEFHFLWIANNGEGTVSKLDTRTGREVGRYASVTHDNVVDIMGVGAGSLPGWGAVHSPSRTAVDVFGDVWVGNRAPDTWPSATKIRNNVDDCVDRNGNGKIDTSTDANGDLVINRSDPAEFFGEADECIQVTVIVGQRNQIARAVAIDAGSGHGDPGNAWVGIFGEQAFYQLDGATGALMKRVPATGSLGFTPYGAAIDGSGTLWAAYYGGSILPIDTVTGTVGSPIQESGTGCTGGYGIAIDLKQRVWLGGWPCGAAFRYDPATATWAEARLEGYYNNGWGGRGIGADTLGNMWMAFHQNSGSYSGGFVARFDADLATNTGIWDVGGTTPVGTAVDFDGNVWTGNFNSSNASRIHVDPVTHEVAPHHDTGNSVDVFPVGVIPYSYSDFTGLGLRAVTRASGEYSAILEACADGAKAHWLAVDFDAAIPAGSELEAWVRAGDVAAAIGDQPEFGAWMSSPADLQAFPGPVTDSRYLQLTLRLRSEDRTHSPIVRSYSVKWTCPNVPLD